MSKSERGPRPESMTAKIYEGFILERPRVEIFTELGLTGKPNKARRASLLKHIRTHHVKDEQRGQFAAWRAVDKPNRPKESYQTEFRLNLSKGRGGTLIKCSPLFLRQFFTDEIVEITGFDKRKILNSRMSAKGLGMEKTTTDMRKAIQKRNHPVGGVREYSLSERNAFRFAKALLEAGLIPLPEDPDPKASLKTWNELHELFKMLGSPPLPENNVDRLRLEGFLRAYKEFIGGDKESISKYIEFGVSVNRDWFMTTLVGEQGFIMSNVV